MFPDFKEKNYTDGPGVTNIFDFKEMNITGGQAANKQRLFFYSV